MKERESSAPLVLDSRTLRVYGVRLSMVLADGGDGEGQEGELLGFEREHQRVASRDSGTR